jgi:hypothetical protein
LTFIWGRKKKKVTSKKYLGQIIQSNGKCDLNIKDHTDKAFGNMSKIKHSPNERPYGKHAYKAALLLREGKLLCHDCIYDWFYFSQK